MSTTTHVTSANASACDILHDALQVAGYYMAYAGIGRARWQAYKGLVQWTCERDGTIIYQNMDGDKRVEFTMNLKNMNAMDLLEFFERGVSAPEETRSE